MSSVGGQNSQKLYDKNNKKFLISKVIIKCIKCPLSYSISHFCHVLSCPFSPCLEAIDMISNNGADIPDIANTACQKHGAIDGQIQMIKCCLKAKKNDSVQMPSVLHEECSRLSNLTGPSITGVNMTEYRTH